MDLSLARNKTKYKLILLLLSLSLYGCGRIDDKFFESRSTETTRVVGKERFIPSKGLKINESINSTYYNEYDKSKTYPPGTTEFYGEMDENYSTRGTNYYDDGSKTEGVVMPGKRLWNIEPNDREE